MDRFDYVDAGDGVHDYTREENRGSERADLEARYGFGNVYDTAELQATFVVKSFLAPFVYVTRKLDGVTGTMEFTHHPRFYFGFVPDAKSTGRDFAFEEANPSPFGGD